MCWILPADVVTPELRAEAAADPRPRPLDLAAEKARYGGRHPGGIGVSIPGVTTGLRRPPTALGLVGPYGARAARADPPRVQSTDRDRVDEVWEQDAFRAVDTSVGALVLQLTRALVGLTLAYVVARIITERVLDLGDGTAAVMAATAVHVGLAGLALFVTSARPIRRDLTAQRALLRASEAEMVERVQQQAFLRDLQDALDMGETEADALEVTAKALRDAAPGAAELLVADASRAHLRRAAVATGSGAPGLRRRDAVGLPGRAPRPHPLLREQRRPVGLPAPVRPRRRAVLGRVRPDHDPRDADRRHPRHRAGAAAAPGRPW